MPAPIQSIPLPVGSTAPDFSLPDVVTGGPVSLTETIGGGVVIDFWSVECPWTRHYDDYLLERADQWRDHGIALLLVNSNANESIEEMRDMADAYGITNPILHDEGCVVANTYGALTTPHIFVVNPSGLIIYQGAIDDRSFIRPEPTINYLDAAVDALISGGYPDITESPAYGCTIVRAL